MRFLCLHGHGTNSQILKAQLDPLLARLPSDWEFEFLDGEMNAEPAPGEYDYTTRRIIRTTI